MAPARAGLGFVRELADPAVADATRFGGKASGLSRMAAAGVPVPPAFVIGAEGFHYFRSHGEKLSGELMAEVVRALRRLEAASGKTFGGVERPLLVSVRSGAAVSMPGMMDTVLNLGLTARSAFALARARGAPDFALDTWLRFWRMYFDTVLDLDSAELTDAARLAEIRARGFDISEVQVLAAQKKSRAVARLPGVRLTFEIADLTTALPETDGSVDLTLCLYSVLSHLPREALPPPPRRPAAVTG